MSIRLSMTAFLAVCLMAGVALADDKPAPAAPKGFISLARAKDKNVPVDAVKHFFPIKQKQAFLPLQRGVRAARTAESPPAPAIYFSSKAMPETVNKEQAQQILSLFAASEYTAGK